AEEDPPRGICREPGPERDRGPELRPGRDALLDLDERRRELGRDVEGAVDAEDQRYLLLRGQRPIEARLGHQAMERRAIGLAIEALDIERSAIARLHHDRDA